MGSKHLRLSLQTSHEAKCVLSARENVRHVLTLLTQDLRQIEEMKGSVRDDDINKFDNAAEASRRSIHEALQRAKIGE